MEVRKFGPLSGPFFGPARGGQASSLVLILHGWGADGNDLADLARPMAVRFPGAAFFVPNGPDPCKMNPMAVNGSILTTAWWPGPGCTSG